MTIQLMVIGERLHQNRRLDDSVIDDVVDIVTKIPESAESTFIVRRCQSPTQLVQIVRRVALEHGKIDTLDLYDHGLMGRLRMGDDILFNDEGKNLHLAPLLRPLLAEHARVRLIGCYTAAGPSGQTLLRDLYRAFGDDGSVVIYGTFVFINAGAFEHSGFVKKFLEERYLVSSTELKDQAARTDEERSAERLAWDRQQRALLRDDTSNPDGEI